ncbi:MarR family transcriptional regulator [Candidatus Berkelbacteria bacterium]|nr:MarR family transcriptional regulator [Candidatus Berkelbacteria bacterium]
MTQHKSFSKTISYKSHKLVFLTNKIVSKTLQKKLDLSFTNFLILMALRRHEKVSQKIIADFLDLTEAAVSRQIEILVEKKLVARSENETNRRAHILTLTAKGIRELESAFKELDQTFEHIYQNISARQRKEFITLLDRLLEELIAHGKEILCPPDERAKMESK